MIVFASFFFLAAGADGWNVTAPLVPQPEAERKAELAARREAVMRKIGPNSVLILYAAQGHVYAADVDQPYREENNFYYLTGIEQTGAVLALIPGATTDREILFLPDKARRAVIYTGAVISAEEAKARTGIAQVLPENKMASVLGIAGVPGAPAEKPLEDAFHKAAQKDEAQLYVFLPRQPDSMEYRQEQALAARIAAVSSGITLKDAAPVFRALRLIKSPREIALIQQAIDISAEGFERAMAVMAPGKCECEIQAEFDYTYARRHARWGYPTIAGSGVHGTTLHYAEDRDTMHAGETMVLDAGAEYDHYSADITRTLPVSGQFTPAQADLYRIVYEAQQAAIRSAHPGALIGVFTKLDAASFTGQAVAVVKEGLLRLGLITSKDNDEFRYWLPHGVTHQLGMNVHDLEKPGLEMAPGMVMTIEPGLYIRPDGLEALPKTPENEKFIEAVRPAFEKYKGIGVRIEDDVLITETGAKVLSAGIPSKLEDVEASMAGVKARLKRTPLP